MKHDAIKINHEVMDALLPAVPADFVVDTQEMIKSLPYRGKEHHMKRKIPVSILLAAILALLAVTALAATILGSKDFVEEYVGPKAGETQSDMFTAEEVKEIIALAQEHGLELPDDLLRRAQANSAGYYKDEFLRAIAKIDLGFYPSTWSIEDQYWFSQLTLRYGVTEYSQARLPEGDEIPEDQALNIVRSYIRENFDANAPVEDGAFYRRHVQYLEHFESEFRKGRMWFIEYEPLDRFHDTYYFQLWSDGSIDQARRIEGIKLSADAVPQIDELRQIYADRYHDDYWLYSNWTEEALMSFQADIRAAVSAYGNNELLQPVRNVLLQTYAPADESCVTRALALQIARKETGIEENDVCEIYGFYLPGKTANYWKVSVHDWKANTWYVEIDAATGEVTFCEQEKVGEHIPYRWAVLEENLPEPVNYRREAPQYVTVNDFWGCDILPKEMWDKLDALGYTSENGSRLYVSWCNTYGEDADFWPDGPYAIEQMWHQIVFMPDVLPGFPRDGDLTAEQAIAAADAYLDEMGSLLPGTAHPAAHIWYGYLEDHAGVWVVDYYTYVPNQPEKQLEATVYVEAASGRCTRNMNNTEMFVGKKKEKANDTAWEGGAPVQGDAAQVAPGDMTYEEALALAVRTMKSVSAGMITEEEMDALKITAQYFENWDGTDLHVWYFTFYREEFGPEQDDCIVYFDAATGEIMYADYGAAEFSNG